MDLREAHLAAAADLTGDEASALVERYGGLARSLALRMARNPHDADDLVQVAMFGLLQALKRFDPDRGFEFSTFAHATITGELKRYRRRTGWALHVPRRLQEGYLNVAGHLEELSQELQRPPTVAEIADRAGMSTELVVELLEVRDAQRTASIDRSSVGGEDAGEGRDLPEIDGGFRDVEQRDLVISLLQRLGGREAEVVRLRFFENMTQRDIATQVGLSQMHVSRILRTALEKLRVFVAG